jgi:hypothetical protein
MRKHEQPTKRDNDSGKEPAAGAGPSEETLLHIQEALRGLRYGSVVVTVQDGVVVQIERTEKKRISR